MCSGRSGASARPGAADVHETGVVGAAQHLRPRRQRVGTLSAPMAAETSGFLTAKVPPKPQHSSAPGSSRSSRPLTAGSSRRGRSPSPRTRSPWQVGW